MIKSKYKVNEWAMVGQTVWEWQVVKEINPATEGETGIMLEVCRSYDQRQAKKIARALAFFDECEAKFEKYKLEDLL